MKGEPSPFLYEYTVWATPHPEIAVEKIPEEKEEVNWPLTIGIAGAIIVFIATVGRKK